MFGSDDWDLDQDFLNDVDDKADKFYSQTDEQESVPKKRKIESYNPIFTANSTSNKPFDNPLLNQSKNDTQHCKDARLPRKDLVLGILKNSNIQKKVVGNNAKNADPQKLVSPVKSNGRININETKISGAKASNVNETKDGSCSGNNLQRQNNFFLNSRKELLCKIMRPQSVDNIKSKNDVIDNALSIVNHQQDQARANKKTTLVRKFPGPAGLLPDDIDPSIPAVSYLNSLEEAEKTIEDNNSSKLSEYCSQNTKNLFSEGAWQLMLDDLPHDLLKGYEIATIKQLASAKGCDSTKVKFLAGMIERIDHTHENPPIVLRDFTDNIQGIIHRDIPLKYPGLLEPNVVVLLHDVGLLKISTTFILRKYQILVSPSNLLGIYTNKGEIERTVHMASVVGGLSRQEIRREEKENKDDCTFNKPSEVHSSKTDRQFKSEDADLFSISPGKITDMQNRKNFNNAAPKKHADERIEEDSKSVSKREKSTYSNKKEQAKDSLQSLKRFAPDISRKKRFSFNSKDVCEVDAEHLPLANACFKQAEQKVSNDMSFEEMEVDNCNVNNWPQRVESSEKGENITSNNGSERNRPSIRSKLLRYKNPDVLIRKEVEPSISNTSNPKESNETSVGEIPSLTVTSNSNNNVLHNAASDSDDEMLSQLDIDTIFSNYNNGT